MHNQTKLIAAAIALLFVGASICVKSLASVNFDFKALNASTYVTNTYEIKENFENIKIQVDTDQIVFAPSEDGKCSVVCYEDEKEPHRIGVSGKTLSIERMHGRRLQIGLFTDSPRITVYLPEKAWGTLHIDSDTGDVDIPKDFTFESIYAELDTGDLRVSASAEGSVRLKTDTGHIELSDMKAEDITVTTDTGKCSLKNLRCDNLISSGDTGDLNMSGVVSSGEWNIRRSTGDVRFEDCDAETITIRTNTGDVTGTLLTEKVFLTKTDTGKTDVPKTVTGGKCDITTSTGDIRIDIAS